MASRGLVGKVVGIACGQLQRELSTRRSLVARTSGWFVESLTVCGSSGSASHGYVSYPEFRVGSRDASEGVATAAEDMMVEQSARPLS